MTGKILNISGEVMTNGIDNSMLIMVSAYWDNPFYETDKLCRVLNSDVELVKGLKGLKSSHEEIKFDLLKEGSVNEISNIGFVEKAIIKNQPSEEFLEKKEIEKSEGYFREFDWDANYPRIVLIDGSELKNGNVELAETTIIESTGKGTVHFERTMCYKSVKGSNILVVAEGKKAHRINEFFLRRKGCKIKITFDKNKMVKSEHGLRITPLKMELVVEVSKKKSKGMSM